MRPDREPADFLSGGKSALLADRADGGNAPKGRLTGHLLEMVDSAGMPQNSVLGVTSLLRRKIVMASMLDLALSGVLWVWAIILCFSSHFDSGVVVFLVTAVAGVAGLYSVTSQYEHKASTVVRMVMFAHGLATLYFMIGALRGNSGHHVKLLGPAGFRLYCVAMAVYWLSSGVFFGATLQKWRKKRRKPRASDSELGLVDKLLPATAMERKEVA